MSNGRGGDARSVRTKDEWLTPRSITDQLGPFDLDPCSPVNRPWPTAKKHFTILDDGLAQPWHGRVWCNPPYGGAAQKWAAKLVAHGNGILLVAVRSDARWFQDACARASALLLVSGRLAFCHVDGTPAGQNPAGSAFMAFGERNAEKLRASKIPGLLFYPPFRKAAA